MIEKEARQVQCCGTEGCGLHSDTPYRARWCIGSRCMAWRWHPKPAGRWMVKLEGEEPAEWNWNPTGHASHARNLEWVKPAVVIRSGYCGLAGSETFR